MDNIKLVSGKSTSAQASSKSDRSSNTVTAPSRQSRPVQSSPVKKAQSKPAPKAQKMKKQKGTGGRKAIIISAVILAVVFASFTGLGVYANGLETIFPNVTMEGTALEGLTVAEAADALVANNVGTAEDKSLSVSLPAGCELTVSGKDSGCYLAAPDAAVYAYDVCHGGGFIANAIRYIKCALSGVELTASSGEKLDESYLHSKIDEGVKQSSLALMESSVDIGDASITVVKGASAVKIDSDKLYATVKDALINGKYEPITYTAEAVDGADAEEIDLQELYDTIFEEPANAEYDPETKQATAHVMGRSFDIDAAKKLWKDAKNGDQVVIPLILTEPEITTEKLNSMLFSEVLAQKSTSLTGSSSARINNITHAAASINGLVLNPGEEFSYNKTLGQRTTAAGYQAAGAYSGGQVVQEVGGGICQVSSTLYYCTLISNLEITERSCHYFGVSYLPAGLDATVSWPTPDFKFKNNGTYPIKIEASVDKAANAVVVKIYGSNPDGIRVEMTTTPVSYADGFGAVSYRNVYDKDGNLISTKQESKSRYYYHVSPSPSPSPSESPSASPSPSATSSPSPTPTQPVTPSPSASVAPASGTDVIA
ncbi:MAG: VanW family protein [Oscillospiraceae bacterium]|nr:VanW family protein [Oscillospiraceae bacterium]